jgi:hypothetical protein
MKIVVIGGTGHSLEAVFESLEALGLRGYSSSSPLSR